MDRIGFGIHHQTLKCVDISLPGELNRKAKQDVVIALGCSHNLSSSYAEVSNAILARERNERREKKERKKRKKKGEKKGGGGGEKIEQRKEGKKKSLGYSDSLLYRLGPMPLPHYFTDAASLIQPELPALCTSSRKMSGAPKGYITRSAQERASRKEAQVACQHPSPMESAQRWARVILTSQKRTAHVSDP